MFIEKVQRLNKRGSVQISEKTMEIIITHNMHDISLMLPSLCNM